MSKPRAILSWSGGKDSAWALNLLRLAAEYEICALITTVNSQFNRIAIHGTRVELLEAQACAAGVPLWQVPLPWPCSNAEYEAAMRGVIARAVREGITHCAFGDLFLTDIRGYREQQLAGTGITPIFPCWGLGSRSLAREMIASGVRARLTCVDVNRLSQEFAGREFDDQLLADLPSSVDPCGENGEFHTFCWGSPAFSDPVRCRYDHTVVRDGVAYAELLAETQDENAPDKAEALTDV